MMDKDKDTVDNPEGQRLEHSYDDDDDTLTMVDVLKEETKLEDDANAVLGASDAQNCTYPNVFFKIPLMSVLYTDYFRDEVAIL